MISRLALIAGLTTALSGGAFAAETYKIDPAHVWVTFTINHAGWSSAHGIFKSVSGTITFDKDDVTKSTVSAQIDATSLDTNLDQRNSDLSSPDFLNTAEFPAITFDSTAITKTGDKTGTITGNFTMIGTTVPVTLDVTWSGVEAAYPWAPDVTRTGFTATGTVSPAAFGMAKVAEYGLGPDITVTIDVEAEQVK
jgi:polyisoprenoid-binding protein YceI